MAISKRNKSIGVFDSGFGGLHILKSIVKELPDYEYIYLGDTARTPYGTRSQEIIYEFTKQAVDFLFENNCELVIFACNTASAEALRKIQREYLPVKYPNKKVLGVLIPLSEESHAKTKNGKVGVLATKSTVDSAAFTRELIKLDKKIKVTQKACPLLVPLVEQGEINSPVTDIILKNYLKHFDKKNIDTLILGCTHYGILENKIKKIIGPNVKIISGEKVVPKKLKTYLEKHTRIEKSLKKNNKVNFYSTDITETFTTLGSLFFGRKIVVKKAELK